MDDNKYNTNFSKSLEKLKNEGDITFDKDKIYCRNIPGFILSLFIIVFLVAIFGIGYIFVLLDVKLKESDIYSILFIVLAFLITIGLYYLFSLVIKTNTVIYFNEDKKGMLCDEIWLFNKVIYRSSVINSEDVLFVANNTKYIRGRKSSYFRHYLSFLLKDGKIANCDSFPINYQGCVDMAVVVAKYWNKPLFIAEDECRLTVVRKKNNFKLETVKEEENYLDKRLKEVITPKWLVIFYIIVFVALLIKKFPEIVKWFNSIFSVLSF